MEIEEGGEDARSEGWVEGEVGESEGEGEGEGETGGKEGGEQRGRGSSVREGEKNERFKVWIGNSQRWIILAEYLLSLIL